ncbi:MAG: hypothetical protein C0483_18890 [Pirellula sp.]|nr:hypothetical protein [Pirellula sp.]
MRSRSRQLLYAGIGLAVVAFLLPWWGLTKYRVSEQRGMNMTDPTVIASITKDMDEPTRTEYETRVRLYDSSWTSNRSLNQAFYEASLGKDYDKEIRAKEAVSLSSGSTSIYGWSAWTAWFGLVFVIAGVALFVAPAFVPDMASWKWLVPWIWTALALIYLIMALAFYFGVPDANGPGYSQGVSLGCYLAIFGGAAAIAGSVFEGLRSAQERLAALENAEEDEEDDQAAAGGKPMPPPKPLDPEEERRRRLNDW